MPQAWDNPDAFVGRVTTLSAYEPFPMYSGSNYSSMGPASAVLMHWLQPAPLAFKSVLFEATLAAGVAGATSQASTGSEGFTYGVSAFLYSRQDYSANSTNVSPVVSGSFALSAAMGYSSTSQTMGMSWNTDTTGGQSTLSTSSNDAGWSNFLNGPRVFGLPLNTTLQAAEFWMAVQHSSTSATSNSNVTLLSVSQLMGPNNVVPTHGTLGGTTTAGSLGNIGVGQNWLVIGGTPVFSTTMALTSNVVAGARNVWFAFRNA